MDELQVPEAFADFGRNMEELGESFRRGFSNLWYRTMYENTWSPPPPLFVPNSTMPAIENLAVPIVDDEELPPTETTEEVYTYEMEARPRIVHDLTSREVLRADWSIPSGYINWQGYEQPSRLFPSLKKEKIYMIPILYRLKTRRSFCELDTVINQIQNLPELARGDERLAVKRAVFQFVADHLLVFNTTEPADANDAAKFMGYSFEYNPHSDGLTINAFDEPVDRSFLRTTFLIHEKDRIETPRARNYFHDYLGRLFNDEFLFGQRFSIHVRYGSSWDAQRTKKWGNGLENGTSS